MEIFELFAFALISIKGRTVFNSCCFALLKFRESWSYYYTLYLWIYINHLKQPTVPLSHFKVLSDLLKGRFVRKVDISALKPSKTAEAWLQDRLFYFCTGHKNLLGSPLANSWPFKSTHNVTVWVRLKQNQILFSVNAIANTFLFNYTLLSKT